MLTSLTHIHVALQMLHGIGQHTLEGQIGTTVPASTQVSPGGSQQFII